MHAYVQVVAVQSQSTKQYKHIRCVKDCLLDIIYGQKKFLMVFIVSEPLWNHVLSFPLDLWYTLLRIHYNRLGLVIHM